MYKRQGFGGAGPSNTIGSAATGGTTGAGGEGGTNSADQTVTTTNELSFADSFNAHDDDGFDLKGAQVERSFNQDNDGVDNAGGRIDDSVVSGRDMTGSGNEVEETTFTNSFNDSHATSWENVGNETYTQTWTNVGNDSSQETDNSTEIDIEDSFRNNTFDPDGLDIDVELDDIDLSGLS